MRLQIVGHNCVTELNWGNLESTLSSFFHVAWDLLSCGQQITSFTWWGFQYLPNTSKILLCTSLEGSSGPWRKAALLFLDCFPLFTHPLCFLISNCFILPFGTGNTPEAEWSLFPTLKIQGQRKAFVGWRPTGSYSVSKTGGKNCQLLEWKRQVAFVKKKKKKEFVSWSVIISRNR